MTPAADKDSESKRRRNALSCAECRRLKLKCDRIFPCASCRKRGCASLCPDHALVNTGKLGGRFILANTEQLHEKVAELQTRISDLEDALAVSHAIHSSHPHPLLRNELLAIKTPLGAEMVGRGSTHHSPPPEAESSPREEVLESFGTLTIGEGGVSTFYGSTVGSEFLYEDDGDNPGDTFANSNQGGEGAWLPVTLSHLAHSFPFATLTTDVESVKYELRTYLPAVQSAWHLAQAFFTNAAWMYNPLHQESFYNEVFGPLYDLSHTKPITSHALSVAFGVLALGALVDIDRQPYDSEATRYHLLARASLAVESCLENTTINAVQSLILMAYFNQMTDQKNGPALTWTMNGLAMKLAQSIGLHRDWEKWGLPLAEVAIRRRVMWECVTFDSWSAFGFGRPPSQAMHFVDCRQTPDPQIHDNPCASFDSLKYRFTEILLEVINASFGATPPTYDDILKLDRRLRDYYIPPLFQVSGFNEDSAPRPVLPPNPPLALSLQSHAIAMLREIALLYMHRSFFAKALSEHAADPFKSRYAPSVLACHRSACAIIILVRKLHYIEPRIILRFWYFWVHSFTAAVVLASIVTKAHRCNLAESSIRHVDLACDLFQQVLAGSRPATTLPILLKIRHKAHEVYTEHPMGPEAKIATPPSDSPQDNLDPLLSGQTRLVSKRKKSLKAEEPGTVDYDEQQLDSSWHSGSMRDVHPTLVDHMKEFYPVEQGYARSKPVPSGAAMALARSSFSSASEGAPYTTSPTFSNPTASWTSSGSKTSNLIIPHGNYASETDVTPSSQAHYRYEGLSDHPVHYVTPHWTSTLPADQERSSYPLYHPSSIEATINESYYHAPGGQSSHEGSYARSPADFTPVLQARPNLPVTTEYQLPDQPLAPWTTSHSHPPMPRGGLSPTGLAYPVHVDPVGGLMHTGGAGSLEQTWRSFLSGVEFPTNPNPGAQQP